MSSTKTKFTPGPWRVDSSSNDQGHRSIDIRDGLNQQIASINPHRLTWRDGDAALITAAPEMFNAISDILNDAEAIKGLCERQVMSLRYVLAKARGEV